METHHLEHTPQPEPSNAHHSSSPSEPHQAKSGAVHIILQWLAYSFWFWSLCLIGASLSGVLIHIFVRPDAESTWILYSAAPLIVLLPLAAITDRYYKQMEPREKHGIAAILMVIHAVVACLSAVGAMVAVVYAILNMLISTSGDFSDNLIACIVSFVIAILSTLFFIRVLYVERLAMVRAYFTRIVAAIAVVTLLLVIVFPLVSEMRRKGDRIVEDNYFSVTSDINKYARENKKLPESLDDVEFDEEAQRAIDTGKLTYKTLTNPSDIDITPSLQPVEDFSPISSPSYYRDTQRTYELCVDWSFERENGYDSSYSGKNFSSYYGHKKGKQCYEETSYGY